MSNVKVTWRGDQVKQRVHAAANRAVRETLDAAVQAARSSHPGWRDRTGRTSASIEVLDVAQDARGVTGRLGSKLAHFLFLEVGFRGRSGDHTLRRAGDVEFGKLKQRLVAATPAEYRR